MGAPFCHPPLYALADEVYGRPVATDAVQPLSRPPPSSVIDVGPSLPASSSSTAAAPAHASRCVAEAACAPTRPLLVASPARAAVSCLWCWTALGLLPASRLSGRCRPQPPRAGLRCRLCITFLFRRQRCTACAVHWAAGGAVIGRAEARPLFMADQRAPRKPRIHSAVSAPYVGDAAAIPALVSHLAALPSSRVGSAVRAGTPGSRAAVVDPL